MAHILFERTGCHAILTLNRPEKLNALSNTMKEDLIDLLEGLGKDDQLRVVVLTATGEQAFCTGTDIAEFSGINSDQALKVSRSGQHLCTLVENFPTPVIAGINGIAAGGGFELMLACHLRVAATSASFSLPETWLGLIPAYGGTQRLAREVGPGRAIEWMLTRRKISATEALESGLLNRVVPQEKLVEESMSLANEIEQLSPLSIRACMKAVSQGLELPLSEGLALETELFASLFATDDAKEGTSAFLEKRKPVFKGT